MKSCLTKTYPLVNKFPEIFILVVASILVSSFMDFQGMGIEVVGVLETSLKIPPKLPAFNFASVVQLIPDIFTIVIVGFIEAQAVTRQGKSSCT
jgi:MFS superfamily sulfate permease-like transporter